MSKLKPSTRNLKFWIFAGGIIVLAGAALAASWPAVRSYAKSESRRLSDQGRGVTGTESEVDFHLAYRLDHSNTDAAMHFATSQLAAGQYDAALATVNRAGEGTEVERLRVKALLELGRTDEAMAAADQLVAHGSKDEDFTMAALAYGVGGNPAAIKPLEARVSSPGALQSVLRAESGNLPLAIELYSTGLLRSSSVLLVKLPSTKLAALYLGRINYRAHTKASLATSADYYASAIALDPSDPQARSEYIIVLNDSGRTDDATRQQQLLGKIVSGTP